MEITESIQIIKALADNSRLMLVQALQEPQCVEELAQRCNLAPSTVCFHLGKLEKAGLIGKKKEQYYAVYSLNDEIFNKSLRELTSFHNPEQAVQDERIERSRRKVIKAFMKNGKVERLPAQYKKRLIIYAEILRNFSPDVEYQEREVDDAISAICPDYCTVRRAFIDGGMMTRSGNIYRVVKQPETAIVQKPLTKENFNSKESTVKTRSEIKREYKERKKPAGVFQIKNTANGKVFLGSSLNLEGPLNSHKFLLTYDSHRNALLQKEWNEYGADAFIFEILEVVKMNDDPNFDVKTELTLLEQIWIEKLQPFGERGYNPNAEIRQA